MNDFDEHKVELDEPYLTHDWTGHYVVLQDVCITTTLGSGIDRTYQNEDLIDANPTEEEIFRLKLKGAYRKQVIFTREDKE